MAKLFATPINLGGLELQNARIHNLASAPASPTAGRIYYDTTNNVISVYNGSSWINLGTGMTTAQVQSIVGAMATSSSTVTATYNSTNQTITFAIANGSITDTMVSSSAAISADKTADGTNNKVYTAAEKTKLGGIASGATANSTDAYLLARGNHTGTESADVITDGTTNKAYTATEKTKLSGIATGATANSTDAYLLARANQTGTQTSSTISDLAATVQGYRLDQFAAPTTVVSFNGQRQTNLADPLNAQDSATKNYVDNVASGLDVKASVAVATTANITLSGLQAIDGYTTVANDRVLVKNQTTASQNGIYVAASGSWTRAGDADNSGNASEVTPGLFTFVENGTTQASSGWVLATSGTITLGTTSLTFVQFSGSGTWLAGNGLTLTGNTFSVKPTTGVTVNAAGVGVDTSVVVRKYAQAIGDGSTTSFTVTHNLGTQDVTVAVYTNSGSYDEIMVDTQHTSTNAITLIFASAPASNAYRVVVHG